MESAAILIVEDEGIIAIDIENRLRRLGYKVAAIASSGEDAVRKSKVLKPDLVLMDIKLAGKMNGVEAASQIYNTFNVPVIYLTAHSDEHTLQQAKLAKPFGYITKPFEGKELHIAIQMALYKHQMEKRLKESAQWFSSTLRCLNEAVVTVDSGGLITFMNPAAELLTGWTHEEVYGKEAMAVLDLKDETKQPPSECPVKGVLRTGQLRPSARGFLITKDGTEVPIDHTITPIQDDRKRVMGAVMVLRDITAHQAEVAALEYQNLHDTVTGLPNRSLLTEKLQQAIHAGHAEGERFCFLFVKMDRFHEINQTMGNHNGILLLQQISQRLWNNLKKTDTVARLGADEFAVVLGGMGTAQEAGACAEKIIRILGQPLLLETRMVKVRIQIGIALFPQHAQDPSALMRCADLALQQAIKSGVPYAFHSGPKT